MTADQLRECREAFEKWAKPEGLRLNCWEMGLHARYGQYVSDDTQLAFEAFRTAWNTRPTAVASHAEDAVAEVCYDSYGFGRMVWRKQFGKGNQPPHGSLLYTHPLRSGDESERTVKENLTVDDEARDAAYWKDRAHAAEDKIASQSLMDVCRQCDECAPYLKEDETPVQRIERERKDVTACLRLLQVERTLTDIDRLVDRFLAWPLPSSVCPDGCVMNRDYPYRVGTNLLTADEAKAMFIHALGRDDAMAARGGE